jgi:hypothetical protein
VGRLVSSARQFAKVAVMRALVASRQDRRRSRAAVVMSTMLGDRRVIIGRQPANRLSRPFRTIQIRMSGVGTFSWRRCQ